MGKLQIADVMCTAEGYRSNVVDGKTIRMRMCEGSVNGLLTDLANATIAFPHGEQMFSIVILIAAAAAAL